MAAIQIAGNFFVVVFLFEVEAGEVVVEGGAVGEAREGDLS